MDETLIWEKLVDFGLTRQEAGIYTCLFRCGEMTGYEVAKRTGISRSNVYGGLSGLTEKGAVYLLEGAVKKYMAVAPEEFCANKIGQLQQEQKFLVQNLPATAASTDGYITIQGAKNIRNKAVTMLKQAKQRVYLSAPGVYIELLLDALVMTVQRGIKLVLITDREVRLPGAVFYLADKREEQLRLIVDSLYVLTGDTVGDSTDTCLYCGQANFVNVFKEALRNEIRLIEWTKGERQNEEKDICDEGKD